MRTKARASRPAIVIHFSPPLDAEEVNSRAVTQPLVFDAVAAAGAWIAAMRKKQDNP